jgi:hypothetical protein
MSPAWHHCWILNVSIIITQWVLIVSRITQWILNVSKITQWKRRHMNARLNMKDINNISAQEHFKCIFLMIRRKGTFLSKCVSMKLLEVSLSLNVSKITQWKRRHVSHLVTTKQVLDFSLREHEGKVNAWQRDFQQLHRDTFPQKLAFSSIETLRLSLWFWRQYVFMFVCLFDGA